MGMYSFFVGVGGCEGGCGLCVCVHPEMQREPQVQVQEMQGAGALPGSLLLTKTPPGRGENVPARSWHGR